MNLKNLILLAALAGGVALMSGCAGSLGNDAVIGLSGSVAKNGQVIGGSLTLASNTVGAGLNYSAPGTNLGLSVSLPLAVSTNK